MAVNNFAFAQDQDDCSKRMLCELNARRESGEQLTDNERIIADSYGGGGEVDINAESLEFDIAALLGKIVSDDTITFRLFSDSDTYHFRVSNADDPKAKGLSD